MVMEKILYLNHIMRILEIIVGICSMFKIVLVEI